MPRYAKNHPAVHPGNPNFYVWASLVVVTLVTVSAVALIQLVLFKTSIAEASFPEAPKTEGWVTDANVFDIAADADRTYLGGDFTYVGEYTGMTAPINSSTGEPINLPKLNQGTLTSVLVEAVEQDGNGGWYAAGTFRSSQNSSADGNTVERIVHFNSDGSYDSNFTLAFTSAAGQVVNDLLLDPRTGDPDDDILYVAGTITKTCGAGTCSNLVAVDAQTGAAENWNPTVNSEIVSMALNGDRLYIGGGFTTVGGSSRLRLAAVGKVGSGSLAAGTADVWAPNVCNNQVLSIAVNPDTNMVYAGGTFTQTQDGGVACNASTTYTRLVAFSGANSSNVGARQTWDPDSTGTINAVLLSTDKQTVYVTGAFSGATALDGANRTRIAALSADVTNANPVSATWTTPTLPGNGNELVQIGSNVIVGGAFTTASGSTRYRVASFAADPSGAGTLQSFDPKANNDVNALATDGTILFTGGIFSSIGGEYRTKLAAFTNSTMDLDTSFDPGTSFTGGDVNALEISGSNLYVAGAFNTNVGRIGRVNKTTGALDSTWLPGSNGTINDVMIDGSNLYVTGAFTAFDPPGAVASTSINRVGRLSTAANTGSVNAADATFNPTTSNTNAGLALTQNATDIYIGRATGTNMARLQKVNKGTGSLDGTFTTNNPFGTSSTQVADVDMSDTGSLYAIASTDLVRMDSAGVTDNTFMGGFGNADVSNSTIQGIYLYDQDDANANNDQLYVGWAASAGFTISGVSRHEAAVVNTIDGSLDSWNPGFENGPSEFLINSTAEGDVLLTGGTFLYTGIAGTSTIENRLSFAAFRSNIIQFTATSSSGSESVTPANLQVTIAATDSSDTTVDYAVTGGSATGSGTDYTLASGTATVTAGTLTTNIPITIVNDSVHESSETIEVTLSSPSSNATLGSNTVHTYTITDNDTVGITVTESGGSTAVTEGGATDSYTIVLTSQPTSSVQIALSSAGQATAAPTPITFTTGNWNTPQTVTVTAANDSIAEGGHSDAIVHAVTSSDNEYNGFSIANVNVSITDNDTAGVQISETSGTTEVTEGGATDAYTVVLTSQPTGDVTIDLSFDAQITAGPDPITFTTENWSTPQTITVTAVDDNTVDDEDESESTITHTAASSDNNYNGISVASVDVAITDNDTAGVSIVESGGATNVTEGGSTDSYTIVLTAQPDSDVTVSITDDSQVNVSESSRTFTNANWDTPQSITVTAEDDALLEGLHSGTITHSSTSGDDLFDGLTIANVDVTITDNDTPSVSITESGGATTATEGGVGDSYTLVLTTQPSADVVITVSPNGQVTAGPSPLTFTNGNWNTPQTVTVNAVDDAVADGAVDGLVSHTAASSDNDYNNLAIASVSVDITDNDTAGITVTQSGGTTDVTEGGATDSFTVVLTSEPTDNVVITLSTGTQASAAPTPLTFTSGNWSSPQTVTVTATNDAIDEDAHLDAVSLDVASSDGNYDNFSLSDVTVTITDNDTAGVTVSQSGGTTTITEGGATDSYTIVLASQPTADVTITITDDVDVSASVPDLTFTSGNWNTPQSVTLTAVNDPIAEGAHTGSVTHSAASGDTKYDAIGVGGVTAQITDNDTAGVTVTQSGGSTFVTEGGATDTYTVVLTSQPTADVQILLSVVSQISVTPSALLFQDSDWNVPQTVMVSSIDDAAVEGTHMQTITQTATSPDSNYEGIEVADVTVTIADNDSEEPDTPAPPTPGEPTTPDQTINQIGGASTRLQSVAVSQARFPEAGTANGAVIANELTAVDAYTSEALVAQNNYVLMLSDGQNISADTLLELDRALGNKGKPIYLVGGTAALSTNIEEDLKASQWTNVLRLAGENRRRTAELVAEAVAQHNPQGRGDVIFLSEDHEMIDGLSAGSATAPVNGYATPILVTPRAQNQLDQTVVNFIKNYSVKRVQIIGGPAALPFAIEEQIRSFSPATQMVRYAGADRFQTNRLISEAFFRAPNSAVAARGDRPSAGGVTATTANTLVTALLANSLGGQIAAPVVLVTGDQVPDPTLSYLQGHDNTLDRLYIVADFNALAPGVVETLVSLF